MLSSLQSSSGVSADECTLQSWVLLRVELLGRGVVMRAVPRGERVLLTWSSGTPRLRLLFRGAFLHGPLPVDAREGECLRVLPAAPLRGGGVCPSRPANGVDGNTLLLARRPQLDLQAEARKRDAHLSGF
jgi:hypothetical protein